MSDTYYPPVGFSFELKIQGADTCDATFSDVSGLDAQIDVVEHREGGETSTVHRLPRPARPENIVLKRGLLIARSPLFDWIKETLEGGLANSIETKSLDLSLVDRNQETLLRWSISKAWPINWSVGSLAPSANEIAIEELELATQGVSRQVTRSIPDPKLPKP